MLKEYCNKKGRKENKIIRKYIAPSHNNEKRRICYE